MPVQPVPAGFHTVSPCLLLKGSARFLDFAQKGLGAEIVHRMDAPDGSVAHAQIKLGDSMIMLGEARAPWPEMPGSIHLYVPDCDALYRRALAAGASSVTEPVTQFYGDRSSGVRDCCGNIWWISTHVEDVSPQELARRMASKSVH